MREILFRGKRLDNGEWVKGFYALSAISRGLHPSILTGSEEGCVNHVPVDPETVGEYTGLHDSDGNDIFEGDIVSFTDCTSTEAGYYERDCIGEVVWGQEEAMFVVTNRLMAESYEVLSECVVIGNIHDNPEMLE